MVDWQSTKITPYLTFVTEGSLIVDMAISTRGLMYLSKDHLTDQIRKCRYIDMKNILNDSPVLMQESSIWRLHCEDRWEDFKPN